MLNVQLICVATILGIALLHVMIFINLLTNKDIAIELPYSYVAGNF